MLQQKIICSKDQVDGIKEKAEWKKMKELKNWPLKDRLDMKSEWRGPCLIVVLF